MLGMWGSALKVRGWLLLVLALHLMVHPMTHAVSACMSSPSPHSLSNPLQGDLSTSGAIDNCDLCRVGQSITAAPATTPVELLNPHWIPVRLHSVSYESLQIAPKLPSRAPPVLL